MDVSLNEGETFTQLVPTSHSSFLYAIEGDIAVGSDRGKLRRGYLGIIEGGEAVIAEALGGEARFLLVAAKSLHEPVARGGPFVMNSREEVMQAFDDYQNNRF